MAEREPPPAPRPNGPAAAAILAAAVGSFVLGLLTTLAELSKALKNFLTWSEPVGPLSGKTLGAVIVWLAFWGVLGRRWRRADLTFDRVWRCSLALILLGFLLTFPPVFQRLGH